MAVDDSPALTGVILVGGRSRRFGSDKAWAQLDGRPLVEWVTRRLALACSELLVVHAKGQPLPPLEVGVPVELLEDRYAAEGPLAGLITAFPRVATPLCFAASVDSPLVEPALVRLLASCGEGFDAVVPHARGFLQPLLAVYRPAACLAPFERALAAGENRVLAALAGLRALEVPESELRTVDPGLRSFINANTPAMLAEIAAMLDVPAG
ncbi:MAG: molybdenum cofactor guanylyltransferase [Dehalococcoidia bacterium]|nr:molybdenum cofactor guanylyltransferase [Dehalococcoidia bacterium]